MSYPVYLVDDDDAVCNGISLLFEARGIHIETFRDPQAFLDDIESKMPGYLVFDLQMPRVSGLDLRNRLLDQEIGWPVIIITGHGDIDSCRNAFRSGVVDFLAKPIDPADLFAALKQAEKHLDVFLERREARALVARLTPRENEILNLICRGVATKEIADALSISHRTVDCHRGRIIEKLGTASVAELIHVMQTATG